MPPWRGCEGAERGVWPVRSLCSSCWSCSSWCCRRWPRLPRRPRRPATASRRGGPGRGHDDRGLASDPRGAGDPDPSVQLQPWAERIRRDTRHRLRRRDVPRRGALHPSRPETDRRPLSRLDRGGATRRATSSSSPGRWGRRSAPSSRSGRIGHRRARRGGHHHGRHRAVPVAQPDRDRHRRGWSWRRSRRRLGDQPSASIARPTVSASVRSPGCSSTTTRCSHAVRRVWCCSTRPAGSNWSTTGARTARVGHGSGRSSRSAS